MQQAMAPLTAPRATCPAPPLLRASNPLKRAAADVPPEGGGGGHIIAQRSPLLIQLMKRDKCKLLQSLFSHAKRQRKTVKPARGVERWGIMALAQGSPSQRC